MNKTPKQQPSQFLLVLDQLPQQHYPGGERATTGIHVFISFLGLTWSLAYSADYVSAIRRYRPWKSQRLLTGEPCPVTSPGHVVWPHGLSITA